MYQNNKIIYKRVNSILIRQKLAIIKQKISLFNDSKIIDSTQFLRGKANEKLKSNEFIFFEDDTHLNELGLDTLSDFILDNLNE